MTKLKRNQETVQQLSTVRVTFRHRRTLSEVCMDYSLFTRGMWRIRSSNNADSCNNSRPTVHIFTCRLWNGVLQYDQRLLLHHVQA